MIYVVAASGPSLTPEQVQKTAHLKTIAVNSSWQIAPHAEIIYAGDPGWWKHNIDKITIPAERWTCQENAALQYGLHWHKAIGGYNSGLRAIQLAIELGAKTVLLLGFDCHVNNGTHWHGDHKDTKNPDEVRCKRWLTQFRQLDRKGAEVINCTPGSALDCFQKMSVDDALLVV